MLQAVQSIQVKKPRWPLIRNLKTPSFLEWKSELIHYMTWFCFGLSLLLLLGCVFVSFSLLCVCVWFLGCFLLLVFLFVFYLISDLFGKYSLPVPTVYVSVI